MSVSTTNNLRRSIPTATRLESAFFERLFEGAGLAVFACEPDGRVRAWNPLAERLMRLAGCWHDGVRVHDVLPVADHGVLDKCMRTCIEKGEPLEFRTQITPPGEPATDYAVWIAPIRDDEGALTGLSVWFHDITDRIQVRRRVRKHERLTSLGMLSGAVSHHYNNLLCSIATSLEYALNMNTMAAMRRALKRTAEAVVRATKLTQQLLAFAQADHRCGHMADLSEIVFFFVDENEKKVTDSGLKLHFEHDPLPTTPVPRDPILITLANLLENAIEASPPGGTITILVNQTDENTARISVIDEGPGIRAEQMDRLFEPFYTTKGELSDGSTRNAGMGLAVAYGLVSELHGTITASNTPAGGARFDICLPIQQPKHAPPPAPAS